jgi:stearoyl-CoA desaturase (delta-9 desaturase)
VGYRNGVTKDNSRNISPIGIIIGGEEFHNNHHLDPGNAKLSKTWWEFDIGWFYIKILEVLKLAKLPKQDK